MHITDLVAKELKLTNVKELEPFVTINGVTVVELETAEGFFRVHLVRDTEHLNVKLEEGSKLAAYYNSLFWHEISTAEKIPIPSAHFKTSFRVHDGENKHSVYITQPEKKGSARRRLEIQELEQVARQIATLHAVNSKVVNEQFSVNVMENHENIKRFKNRIQGELIEVLQLALSNELSQYFSDPASILDKVRILTHHLDTLRREDEEEPSKVITHGRLTAESCRFDEDGKLVEITGWENIHLGNPAEDLTNLIVSSADVTVRRKKYQKILQIYFYTLVDIHPPTYQLTHLKKWFRDYQAQFVVEGIEPLLLTLSESPDDLLKQEAAHQWQCALDDTVDYLTGNYISDDEQTFFSQKED